MASDSNGWPDAAREVATALRGGMIVRPDLLVVFGSFPHRALFSAAPDPLRAELHPAHLLASTARAVIGAAVHDGRASPAVGVEGRAALGAVGPFGPARHAAVGGLIFAQTDAMAPGPLRARLFSP